MKIAVIGAGRVGLSLGAVLAARGGHDVGFIDRSLSRLKAAASGFRRPAPFEEPRLRELLREALKKEKCRFALTQREACALASQASFVFFTMSERPAPRASALRASAPRSLLPQSAGSSAQGDMSAALSWAGLLAPLAQAPQIFVLKSSFPIGTFKRAEEALKSFPLVSVIVSPEFLRQGAACEDLLHPDRLVIGSRSLKEGRKLARLYRSFCKGRAIFTSPETAELSKLVCNSGLALSISFMNEMADISAAFNGSFKDLAGIMAADPRLRALASFRPGIGYGGRCLPKDIRRLEAAAARAKAPSLLLKAAIASNQRRPDIFFQKIAAHFQPLKARRLAFHGLGFKGGADDWTASPAVALMARLLSAGACVRVYDPYCPRPPRLDAGRRLGGVRLAARRLVFCSSFESALRGAEGLILGTEARPPLSLRAIKNERPRLSFIADSRGAFGIDELRASRMGFCHPAGS